MIRIDDAVDMEYTEKKERRWKGCGSPIEPRREKKKKKKKKKLISGHAATLFLGHTDVSRGLDKRDRPC
jgi:hypothetical protein